MTSSKENPKDPKSTLTKWARTVLIAGLLGALAIIAAGCETGVDEAGDKTQNVIKEVNEAYGNVKESVDKTKTWVNTKVDQAEQATEDVQKAAESLNNAVNSLREFTSLGEEETTETSQPSETPGPQGAGESE